MAVNTNFEFENSQEEADKEAPAHGDSDSSYDPGNKKKKASTNRTTAGQKKPSSSSKKTTTPRLASSSTKPKLPSSSTTSTSASTSTASSAASNKRKSVGGAAAKTRTDADSDSDVEQVTKPLVTTTITTATETKELKGASSHAADDEEEPLFTQSKKPAPVLSSVITSTTVSTSSSAAPSSSSSHHHSESSSHRESNSSSRNHDNTSSTSHRTPSHHTRDPHSSSSKTAPTSGGTRESSRDGRDGHRREASRERGSERGESRTDARFNKPRRESDSFISSVPVSRLGKARPATVAPTPTGRSAVRDMLDELVKRCALFGDVGSSSMEPERGGRKRGEDSKDEDFPQDLFSPKTCRGVEDVLRVLDGRLLLLARLVSHHLFLYPSVLDSFSSLTLPQKLRLISKGSSRQRALEHGDSDTEANEQGTKDTLRIRAIMDELCEKYLLVGGPHSENELEALFEDCETVKDALRLNPWSDLLPNIRLHALLNPHISKPFRNMSVQEKMVYFDGF